MQSLRQIVTITSRVTLPSPRGDVLPKQMSEPATPNFPSSSAPNANPKQLLFPLEHLLTQQS